MIKQIIKILTFSIFLYFFIMLQSSILPFSYLGLILSIFFVLGYSFVESASSLSGIIIAIWAGILLDIYSSSFFFGFYAIVLMAISILIKTIISRYVRIP